MSIKKHLPGLDGIRALAAIIVLIGHVDQNIKLFGSNLDSFIKHYEIQGLAVTIFFVLSGFLITFLLLNEKETSGKINFSNFYMRRILKIWPLYFLIIFISFIIAYIKPNIFWKSNTNYYFYYLLFIGNIAYVTGKTIKPIITFWSISVEEQFYLFWPFLIKNKNVFRALIVFVIFFVITKIFLWRIDKQYAYWLTETRFSCMAIGAIGAYLYHSEHRALRIIYNPYLQLFSWLLLSLNILSNIFYKPINIGSIFQHEFYSIFFLIIIMNVATNKKTIFTIDNSFFNLIGKLSYGIYCWHMIIILLMAKLFSEFSMKNAIEKEFIIHISVIASTFIISYISYFYFEKNILKLKQKFPG
ncbi:acyltransferase family protein [Mucilaginibacter sp. RCC_168]|uniref:acyltransferase family protein n=1 Tax=Mucilaginibacter sp. RCC_168 TaxID=3239221 RepID=UPI0035238E2F